MKKILFNIALFSVFTSLSAQTGHEIKINFKNCKDSVAYLAYYQFDKSYLADTCKKIVKGNIIFKGKNNLDKGVYYLVSQDKARYFDFFVDDQNQHWARAGLARRQAPRRTVRGSASASVRPARVAQRR